MVDREKIRKRKRSSSDQSSGGESIKDVAEDAKKRSSSRRETSASSGGDDIKRLMFCLGNTLLYSRTLSGFSKQRVGGKKANVLETVSSDITGEMIDFMGVFGVRNIGEKYGCNFKDVLDAIEGGDKFGKSIDSDEGNVSKSDVKDLLDCLANVILYTEGIYRKADNSDDEGFRDEKTAAVAGELYDEFKDLASRFKVQRIAEKHGYSWKEDILKTVLEDQDYEKIMEDKWK
jgi:hypothetical protein